MKHFCSEFESGAKMNMEKVPVELGVADELEEAAWMRIDVILDEIFKYLSVAELKELRLVNKSFCVTGAKHLARRSLVRLTGIVDLRPVAEKVPVLASHCSLDADYYFECECQLDSPKDYIHIDSFMEHVEQAAFDSGLVVKHVSVVSSSDIWLLPLSHFSRLELLQVVTLRPSDGFRILDQFPRLFPNLKTLDLKYIQKDGQTGDTESGNEPFQMEIEDEKPGTVADIQLENLAITVSADWDFVGSSMFHRFRKLKTLKILWCAKYPLCHDELEDGIRYNQDGELFRRWLQEPTFHSGFPKLSDVSLRFDLTPENLTGLGSVLNSMKLAKLSLELYGHDFELARFILSLQPKSIAALTKVHWGTAEHRGMQSVGQIRPALTWLTEHGFFTKTEWTFTIQASGDYYGLFSIVKTKSQLTRQRSFMGYGYGILEHIFSQVPQIFSQFNYAFRRYCFDFGVVRYKTEKLGAVDPDFGSPELWRDERFCQAIGFSPPGFEFCDEWHRRMRIGMRGKNCQCSRLCRKPTVLLCEFPVFLQVAGVVFPHEHPPYYSNVLTDVFCYVLPTVMEAGTRFREQWILYHIARSDFLNSQKNINQYQV